MTYKNCSLLIIGVACGLLMAFVLSFAGYREGNFVLIGGAVLLFIGLVVHRMSK